MDHNTAADSGHDVDDDDDVERIDETLVCAGTNRRRQYFRLCAAGEAFALVENVKSTVIAPKLALERTRALCSSSNIR